AGPDDRLAGVEPLERSAPALARSGPGPIDLIHGPYCLSSGETACSPTIPTKKINVVRFSAGRATGTYSSRQSSCQRTTTARFSLVRTFKSMRQSLLRADRCMLRRRQPQIKAGEGCLRRFPELLHLRAVCRSLD